MSLAPAILTQQSEPQSPRNAMFTCLACHVAFPTSDRQRQHYRTDWHKYNLKRKIANLTPVTAEQFAQKVLAQQAKGREEAERAGLVYECVVCRKTYLSENAFTNHIYSRKHKEMEAKGGSRVDALINQHKREVRMFSSEGESDAESHGASVSEEGTPRDPLAYCLFCSQVNTDFEMNLDHMASVHGFFLPDIEYLEDTRGLIAYLVEKVQDGICIYCNGRGREWKSVEAVRSHMLDKGHCKMAYDESEDPDALLRFYDFGPIDLDDESDTAFNVKDAELILNNGARLGHRNDLRYFKQRLRKNTLAHDDIKAIEQEAHNDDELESPKSRQRKQRLAITNGRYPSVQLAEKQGIKEASVRQNYGHQVAFKHNLTNTLRARNQNPI